VNIHLPPPPKTPPKEPPKTKPTSPLLQVELKQAEDAIVDALTQRHIKKDLYDTMIKQLFDVRKKQNDVIALQQSAIPSKMAAANKEMDMAKADVLQLLNQIKIMPSIHEHEQKIRHRLMTSL